MLDIGFAGSGDALGSGGRFQACIHVRPQGETPAFLVDCGATSLVALKRQGLDPNQIGTGVRHPRVDASAALAEHRDQLACGRVVVTHMSSDMLAKMDQTPFDPASDGLELQV